MSYASALFTQLLPKELQPGRTIRQSITAVLERMAPTTPDDELRIYVNALYGTIATGGALRPDWQERVARNH